jgi:hypothetical protein
MGGMSDLEMKKALSRWLLLLVKAAHLDNMVGQRVRTEEVP